MATLQPPRGIHDLLPDEAQKHLFVIETARAIAARYGFAPISTPLLEFKEVFKRTLGTTSDVVSKEMYEIIPRGEEELVLRPEGTAGIARAILSNGLTQSMPLKLFYTGPMFRYERPQKGRLRQHHQIGVELFGMTPPLGDLEVLSLAYEVLKALGLNERTQLEINTLGDEESRTRYRAQLVTYLKDHMGSLSPESRERLEKNPLRILDSKDEGDKKILKNAPLLTENMNAESADIFLKIQEGLGALGIPFTVNPHIVRGLDYYSHLAFEFTTTDLGAQGTVLAGGRYDGLLTMMGGPELSGVGWAAGIERLVMMLSPEKFPPSAPRLALVAMDEALTLKALTLAHHLRAQGFTTEVIIEKNLGKGLKKANKIKASFALILGEEEAQSASLLCKDLTSGEQALVPQSNLISFLRENGVS